MCLFGYEDDVEPDTTAAKKGKGKEPGDPDKAKPNKRRKPPNDAGKPPKKPTINHFQGETAQHGRRGPPQRRLQVHGLLHVDAHDGPD
eukprot:9968378-Alexandrium_andersonii.AAC.1